MNITILCFVKRDSIQSRIKNIEKKYKTKELKKFIKYFKSYWLSKLKPELWNSFEFIELNKNNLEYFYVSNNASRIMQQNLKSKTSIKNN